MNTKTTLLKLTLLTAIATVVLTSCSISTADDTPKTDAFLSRTQGRNTANSNSLPLPYHPNDDQIIRHNAYTLSYSEQHEQARWTIYMLTKKRAHGRHKRQSDFRPDDAVATESAQLYDYKRSGYTRGHLVPAGDMKWDSLAMSETFFLSNMSPQLADFNDGIWNNLENRIRSWSGRYDTLYVVTGPVLRDKLPTIGRNKVSVPEYFYKVVLDPSRQEGIAFIVPHRDSQTSLYKFAVSIDSVEKATGIDFFPSLPDDVEDKIESSCNTRSWTW